MSKTVFKSFSAVIEKIQLACDFSNISDVLFWSQVLVAEFGKPSQQIGMKERSIVVVAASIIRAKMAELEDFTIKDLGRILLLCLDEISQNGTTSYTNFLNLLLVFEARSASMLASVKAADLKIPKIIHLETIARCNAGCGFCPYPDLKKGRQNDG